MFYSSYNQYVELRNNKNSRTLKDMLIHNGHLTQAKETYTFMNSPCDYISQDGNTISVCFDCNDEQDFFEAQEDTMKQLSKAYPDMTLYFHSSYCGGSMFRETCIDTYMTNGKYTDSKGRPCKASITVPVDYISIFDITDYEYENEHFIRAYARTEADIKSIEIIRDRYQADIEEEEYNALNM